MSRNQKVLEVLGSIQQELDQRYVEFVKEDFMAKLRHHKKILPFLAKRDQIVLDPSYGLSDYWERSFLNYELGREILPVDARGSADVKWVKSLKAEYLNDYVCFVQLELYENEYVENKVLSKKIDLESNEIEASEVAWKSGGRRGIFLFFESDQEDFEVFDILYELYVNASFYYAFMDEEEAENNGDNAE
jgi:hypothetical protein